MELNKNDFVKEDKIEKEIKVEEKIVSFTNDKFVASIFFESESCNYKSEVNIDIGKGTYLINLQILLNKERGKFETIDYFNKNFVSTFIKESLREFPDFNNKSIIEKNAIILSKISLFFKEEIKRIEKELKNKDVEKMSSYNEHEIKKGGKYNDENVKISFYAFDNKIWQFFNSITPYNDKIKTDIIEIDINQKKVEDITLKYENGNNQKISDTLKVDYKSIVDTAKKEKTLNILDSLNLLIEKELIKSIKDKKIEEDQTITQNEIKYEEIRSLEKDVKNKRK
jgi:hypothetical protein